MSSLHPVPRRRGVEVLELLLEFLGLLRLLALLDTVLMWHLPQGLGLQLGTAIQNIATPALLRVWLTQTLVRQAQEMPYDP